MVDLSGAWSAMALALLGDVDGRLRWSCANHPGACRVCSGSSARRRRADGCGHGLGLAWRMSKVMKWCIGLALAGVLAGGGQSAAAVGASGSWGRAVGVPGL